MKKQDKKYLLIAILLNVGIIGGVALIVVGIVTEKLWLCYVAIGFIGVIGVMCSIFSGFLNFKAASPTENEIAKKQPNAGIIRGLVLFFVGVVLGWTLVVVGMITEIFWLCYVATAFVSVAEVMCLVFLSFKIASPKEKEIAKKQLSDAKKNYRGVSKKERTVFIILAVVIVSLCVFMFVFGKLLDAPVPMFVCVGLFVGVGVVGGLITFLKQRKVDNKIYQSDSSEKIKATVNSREAWGSKFRYKFLIGGKTVCGISPMQLEEGDTVTVLYDKSAPKHCFILTGKID